VGVHPATLQPCVTRERHCKIARIADHLDEHYSVTINGNWRLTFTFDGENAELVDYLDYH